MFGLFAWSVLSSFFGWDATGWAIIHQCVGNVKMTKLTIIYIKGTYWQNQLSLPADYFLKTFCVDRCKPVRSLVVLQIVTTVCIAVNGIIYSKR
jgi:hypothetical protein